LSDFRSRAFGFVESLNRLTKTPPNLGALADLRSGLPVPPGHAPRMHRYIVPFLEEKPDFRDRWFYTVGALFGAHQRHKQNRTFATAFRAIYRAGSESIGKRFIAMLAAHPNDLHKHLVHAIGLLAKEDEGFDYVGLLEDLARWTLPDMPVQNRWARDFYRKDKETGNGGE